MKTFLIDCLYGYWLLIENEILIREMKGMYDLMVMFLKNL